MGTISGRSCGAVAQLHERGSPGFARENLETLGRHLAVLKPGRNIKTVRLNAEITAHGIPGARLYRYLIGSKLGVFGDLVFIGFGFTCLQIDDDVATVLGFFQPIDSPGDLGVHGIAGNQNPEGPLHAHEFAVITRHNLVDIHREFINHFLCTFTYLLPLPSIRQRKRTQALFKLTAQGHIIGVRVLFCDRVNERSQRARGVGLRLGTSRRYEPVQGRLMNRLDTRGRYRNCEFFGVTRVSRQTVAMRMRCKRILLGRER